jgi:hypothetical protein
MIPCKSRFPCIGFPRHLVGMTSLLQYKIFTRMQLLNNNNNNKKMVWQFNEALTLSHVWSVTFVVPSCSWYTQLAVHIYAPILTINHNLKSSYSFKTSFVEINCSLTPAIPFKCHQPKLINRLSRSSLRMPLAEANHSFIPVIHSDAISRS